jgi:hypothetical protein
MDATQSGHTEAGASSEGPASPSFRDQWISEYKARENLYRPTMLTLPSAKQVMVSRMPLHILWTKGLVPDILTARVQDWVSAIEATDPASKLTGEIAALPNDQLIERYQSWLQMMDFVWCTCVTEPTFVMMEDEQDVASAKLWVGDVDLNDKVYLFSFVQGVDQSVEEFFREQGEIVGALPDGDQLLNPSERLLWVERTGGRVVGIHDRSGDVRVGDVHSDEDRRDETRPGPETAVETTDDSRPEIHPGTDQFVSHRPARRRASA